MSTVVPFNASVELRTPISPTLERQLSQALRPFGAAVGGTVLGWVTVQLTVLAPDVCDACATAIAYVRDVVLAPVLSVEARVVHESDAI